VKVLVTGGVRSGKSRHAESLLEGFTDVVYVAPGPTADEDGDPDWAARLAAHQARRPTGWTTLESRDLAAALGAGAQPVIVDCLGTWLTAVLDERCLWDSPIDEATVIVERLLEAAIVVLTSRDNVVLVTNEVGLGVVPAHRSGRLFRDLLGLVNQRMAAACDDVHLVVAGRVLTI
jgi:adenosylcobinamide kinase/adenosylcobinamide-phosphate guanylyltransferase